MNDLCFSFYLWSQVIFHRHFIGNQDSSNIGETHNKTTNEPTPVHVAIKQKGATMFNVTLRLGISAIAVIGTVMCHDGFSPLYTPQINGIGRSNETAVQVYIPPPSTEASCSILCSLTPGCVWVKFYIDTGRYALSHSVCPRPTESQESYLVAGNVSGNVGLWGCHYDHHQRWIYDAKTGK